MTAQKNRRILIISDKKNNTVNIWVGDNVVNLLLMIKDLGMPNWVSRSTENKDNDKVCS